MENNVDGARKRYGTVARKGSAQRAGIAGIGRAACGIEGTAGRGQGGDRRAIAGNPGSVRPHIVLITYCAQLKDAKGALAAARSSTKTAFPENPQILEVLVPRSKAQARTIRRSRLLRA